MTTQTTLFDQPTVHSWPSTTRRRPKKVFLKPSETVPGQSMTPAQLVKKHAQGIDLGSIKTPMFDDLGVSMGINPKTLDMIDLHEMVNTNRVAIDKLSAQKFEAEQYLEDLKRQADIVEGKRQEKINLMLEKETTNQP